MQDYSTVIASKIRSLRIAKGIKQANLDKEASLPVSSISKIERGIREATASELVRIAHVFGVPVDTFATEKSAFVYLEEIKVIEALREIPFEDYQRILRTIEAQVYFAAKDASTPLKEHLRDLVSELTRLSETDSRPRSDIANKKRVRN